MFTKPAGKFTWNEKGNTITLTPADKSQTTQYLVGENLLTQLDKQGNKITGDNASRYVLSKSNYEILEKYWKLVELNGKDVVADSTFIKEPHIIFKEGNNRIIGNGGCNSISGEYKIESLNSDHAFKNDLNQNGMPTIWIWKANF